MTEPRLPALAEGACIGLVAPASSLPDEAVRSGIARLEALGFRVRPHLPPPGAAVGRLAACDRTRADHLVGAFDDPEVDAVLAVCGGYGVMRLWPHLPERLFRESPKPLVGYSDVTALLSLAEARGATAIHGPMLCDLSAADEPTLDGLRALLRGDADRYGSVLEALTRRLGGEVAAPVAGVLRGGNLSLVAATVGTPFELARTGRPLLLLEDWNEPAYRIDRMLLQLQLGGLLESSAGVLVGHMTNIAGEGEQLGSTVAERIRSLAAPSSPVVTGVPSGHEMPNIALVLGRVYTISATGLRLGV